MQTAAPTGFKITPSLKKGIVKIIDDRIKESHVTKEDFSELKGIVKDLGVKVGELAEAQKRTEQRVEELAEAQKRTEQRVEELADAQKRTEQRVEELADAQKRTEIRMEELIAVQKEIVLEVQKIDKRLEGTEKRLGGLSKSFSYAMENEAYKHLPEILRARHGLKAKEKIVRANIGGEEINFFGRADKEGREVLIVGETKLRLDERREKKKAFEQLEAKVNAVVAEYGQVEIIRVLVTHFATKGFLEQARAKDIIVVQSFEW